MFLKKTNEAIQSIKQEVFIYRRHKAGMKKARKINGLEELRLHLACGNIYKKGWLNIDLFSQNADFGLDLRRALPFEDNSCDEIYSEHFLEHLDYPEGALQFLSELRRVIKPGKKVTTGVPDTAWPLKSYSEGENAEYFRITREKEWHPVDVTTPMEHINYHFRQNGEHLYAYDEETLIKILREAGFSNNRSRKFDPEMDSAYRQPGSLYIESIKT